MSSSTIEITYNGEGHARTRAPAKQERFMPIPGHSRYATSPSLNNRVSKPSQSVTDSLAYKIIVAVASIAIAPIVMPIMALTVVLVIGLVLLLLSIALPLALLFVLIGLVWEGIQLLVNGHSDFIRPAADQSRREGQTGQTHRAIELDDCGGELNLHLESSRD